LSHIIVVNNEFYDLRISDNSERVFITKNTMPRGTLVATASLKSGETVPCWFGGDWGFTTAYAGLTGVKDPSVNISAMDLRATNGQLPALAYRALHGGELGYGPEQSRKRWTARFQIDSEIRIKADKTTTLELGNPAVMLAVVDHSKRKLAITLKTTTFEKGQVVQIAFDLLGIAGERYDGLTRGGKWGGVRPEARILNSKGETVDTPRLEYGWRGSRGFSWKTEDVEPGEYKAVVTQETGPLAGKIEGSLKLTIR
jgi:hypothetical protein